MANTRYQTIDQYFADCEPHIVSLLSKIREVIRENAPTATEKISWGMPTFYLDGNLVHFFAHKNHIGFYPGASGIEKFKDTFDNLGYAYSKGAVQFPISKEIPYDLIANIVKFRVKETEANKTNHK